MTGAVLEYLLEGAATLADIAMVMLEAPYGTSASGFEYRLQQKRRARDRRVLDAAALERARSFIAYLKRDGLIEGSAKSFRITAAGRKKLAAIVQWFRKRPVVPRGEAGECAIVVSYDIPERMRAVRKWLYGALTATGLYPVQKSVFVGKRKIPRELIAHIRRMRLEQYVEIFEVTKSGTLRHIL